MRFVIPTTLTLFCAFSASGNEAEFFSVKADAAGKPVPESPQAACIHSNSYAYLLPVKASLVFREDEAASHYHYPHVLRVYLRLDNVHDSDVSWVANSVTGIEAELLDAAGKPVPQPAGAASIQFNSYAYLLPFGSRLDWLVSHGGISFMADPTDKYALMVGGRGWLIPIEAASSYSLCIRLRGLPWIRTDQRADYDELKVLVEVPATKIEITK